MSTLQVQPRGSVVAGGEGVRQERPKRFARAVVAPGKA